MKRTVDLLKPSERQALIDLYEGDGYKALRRLIEIERDELAKKCLFVSSDQLSYVQGQAHALKQLHQAVQELYKEDQKKG